MNLSRYLPVIFIIILNCMFCTYSVPVYAQENKMVTNEEYWGSRDFIAFWSGSRAFIYGGNPYRQEDLIRYQQPYFPAKSGAQAFLNPPWMLPFFSAFAVFDFHEGRWIYSILNISLYLCAVLIVARKERLISAGALGVLLISTPMLYCIFLGQLSIIVTVSALTGWICYLKKRFFLSGMALGVFAIKPQLCIVLLPCLFMLILKNRQWRLASGLLVLPALGVILAWLWQPEIFRYWLSLDYSPSLTKTSTVTNFVREWIGVENQTLFKLALWLVPLAGALICLLIFFRNTGSDALVLVGCLIPLGLLFAPYLLFYDYTLLFLSQIGIARYVESRQKGYRAVAASYLVLQLVVILHAGFPERPLQQYIYYPIGVLLISAWILIRSRSLSASER